MLELELLHPVSREHLDALTDETGIMQHADGPVPDPAHGYCTDDVARALIVDLLHQQELGWAAVKQSVWRSLRFLVDAFDPCIGRFRNFRAANGVWLDSPGSEDAHGRAILALGEAIAGAPDARLREAASSLFEQALPATLELTALRARAAALLGCDAALRGGLVGRTPQTYRLLATGLRQTFEAGRLSPKWPWPEPALTYENALPARALIVSGQRLGYPHMSRTGRRVLDWLLGIQTASDGHLTPLGNDRWWPREGVRAQFDQQPIEATTLLLAAEAAYEATSDDRYRRAMEQAYAWFLGRNDLGIPVADPERGACRDGLTPRGVNENQGAESTLMWLIALERIRALRERAGAAGEVTRGLLVAAGR